MTDFTQLKDFLLSTFRQDVIIPCQKGMKFPSFAYRQNLWTWNDLDKIINKNIVEVDYAIILKTLCVIDCDTEAAAQDLTDTFPCLLTAPCAKTNRGFHFYFRRSVLADREGFWDQIGTKIKKIDFKTRCQTGTGKLYELVLKSIVLFLYFGSIVSTLIVFIVWIASYCIFIKIRFF